MPFSASSVYASALSNSRVFPGGRPTLETGGTFQPTTNEKIAIARSNADDQFDSGFIEQFKGAMQNRLNQLTGQLQQAYNGLLQASSAGMVKDGLGATDNKFLFNGDPSKMNGYQGYTNAFAGIGGQFTAGTTTQLLADVDQDGKRELGNKAVTSYAAITGQPADVRFRAFGEYGAALDIKQKIGITMRSEETNDPALGPISPGLNTKVKEYETSVSQGGFWAGINYLYAWRPSQMQYTYVDGYSQNSDAAGFKGYLSEGKATARDAGDGSFLGSGNGDTDRIKWQGGGFSEGYLATKNSDLVGNANADTGPYNSDVGLNAIPGDDDLRFANTYYVQQRSVKVDTAVYNLADFAANNSAVVDGWISQEPTVILNNHDHGLGYYDVVNGNNYYDAKVSEALPGAGRIEETFNGNWIGKQFEVTNFNGNSINGNANAPIFGNFELARFQTYQDPDEWRNDAAYVNGYNVDPGEANYRRRAGQLRQFVSGTGNSVREVDQRPQDQNSLAELILEIMRKPAYKDLFRLGLFKDVVIQGGANAPAGGVVNGTIRLSYVMSPVWADAYLVPGKGVRPGIRGEMLLFQDKYQAKGA